MWLIDPLPSNQPWCYWEDAFSSEELKKMSSLENLVIEKATVGNGNKNSKIRESDISWVHGIEDNRWLYEKLTYIVKKLNEDHFHLELRAIQTLQYTEYNGEQKGFFGQHIDAGYSGVIGSAFFRKLSFTVQLSSADDYEGGELILYPESFLKPVKVKKELGLISVFRSHIIHEVLPVTRGVRKSLVGWVEGPILK